ncbi:hypothetical protein QBC39DRAFT_67184 [Podospora conica]|nr:hypothetical protein QBC39DRAFT_67184 [Schizothecium conicum]
MPSSHIIHIPRTDAEGTFVLGEVTSSGGSKPLNLTIVATEGEAAYSVKLRHDKITTHLTSSAPCSPAEWESILTSLLLPNGTPPPAIEPGAEVSSDGESLVITIRRRVAGINQRLGTLTLPASTSPDAIQLFDWCTTLALERAALHSEAAASAARAQEQETQIAELRAQLAELTDAKKRRETELLEKFCVLLNEKKVKIREQQTLLAGVEVGDVKVPLGGGGGGGRGKRKVREEEEEDKMDVDEEVGVSPEEEGRVTPVEEEGRVTPQGEETETGSEGEDDEPAASYSFRSPPKVIGRGGGAAGKGKGKAREVTPSPPPPVRATRRKPTASPEPEPEPAPASIAHRTRHAAAVAAKPDEGSETESDDEL